MDGWVDGWMDGWNVPHGEAWQMQVLRTLWVCETALLRSPGRAARDLWRPNPAKVSSQGREDESNQKRPTNPGSGVWHLAWYSVYVCTYVRMV